MRIAFVSELNWVPWGGSEVLWSKTAEALLDRGHRLAVATKWWPALPAPVARLGERGAELHPYYRPRTVVTKAVERLRGVGRPAGNHWERWAGWVDQFRPDLAVISLGHQIFDPAMVEPFRRRGVPYALLVQACTEIAWPLDPTYTEFATAYAEAAACYFVSRANQRLLERQIGRRLPHATVVRNPFQVRHDARPDWPPGEGQTRLACVARLDAYAKGTDTLFDVMARPKWRARPVHVDLFGSGMNELALRDLAAFLELPNVTFCGHVADIEQVWATHHALVLASRAEGLPLALVEAMLCGRPPIVTAVAGNPEVVTDGETGFLAHAPTEAALDDALERAWARRQDWPEIGRRAADSIRSHVPSDPAAVFADRLLALATSHPGSPAAPPTP